MPISRPIFHQIIKKWKFLKSTDNGLLKKVSDGISRLLGSRKIEKTKVDTLLWDNGTPCKYAPLWVGVGITNLVACFHWGKRLLGNLKNHFRDLCWVGALSRSGGKGATLIRNEESQKILQGVSKKLHTWNSYIFYDNKNDKRLGHISF